MVVGVTLAQRSVPISSGDRLTLHDTIFNGGGSNSVTSDFSKIYVIHKYIENYLAYHLDISNPVRINWASKFEMRPNDIVFVASQPVSLFIRSLKQILDFTGLTFQAKLTIIFETSN